MTFILVSHKCCWSFNKNLRGMFSCFKQVWLSFSLCSPMPKLNLFIIQVNKLYRKWMFSSFTPLFTQHVFRRRAFYWVDAFIQSHLRIIDFIIFFVFTNILKHHTKCNFNKKREMSGFIKCLYLSTEDEPF